MSTGNRFELLGAVMSDENEEGRDWGIESRNSGRNGRISERNVRTPARGMDGGGRAGDRGTGMEREEQMDTAGGGNGAERTREETRKRTVVERSPNADEEARNLRRRLNEFDVGETFQEIMEVMKREIASVVSHAQDGVKEPLREGLETVYLAVSKLMSKVNDGIAQERMDRDAEMLKVDDRIEKVEASVKHLEDVADSLTENRIMNRVKESAADMERKVSASMNNIRVMDIDLGIQTDNKKVIVKATIDAITGDTKQEDRMWLTSVLRRTRIVVLGKGTQQRLVNGKNINTVPILFCCQNKLDAGDLDTLLRRAGLYPGFHWPEEILPFLRGVRDEVKKMGVDDRHNYIRIRPEEREGGVQIRADCKPKNGGRFGMKGVWRCPPLNNHLWDGLKGLFTPKVVGRQ